MSQNSLTPERVIAAARLWLGTPYQHQASLKGVGCDCLGLLRGVWRDVLGEEPERPTPYGPGWAETGGKETLLEAAQRHLVPCDAGDPAPGRILLFRWRGGMPVKHCGIATSATHFIHAHDGACVAEVPLIAGWRRRIAAMFEFPEIKEE
jgi:NlpC/P60 family putative phage cell wall peptidase